ncbi:MAG: hypothetical protein U9R01_07855, partial [candidate division WOR-3 bacterium]|nr:hypothetical protein [candidate division WOR-3 bacterium]
RAKTPGKIQGEAPAIAEVMSVYNKAAKGNKKALAQIREWLSAGYLVTDETGNLKGNPDIYGG